MKTRKTLRRSQPSVSNSRQVVRRVLFERAKDSVNERNLRLVGDSHYRGLPRKERRALAKAYAAGQWREMRAARPAKEATA